MGSESNPSLKSARLHWATRIPRCRRAPGGASANRSSASDRCQVGVKSWVLNCLLERLSIFVDGRFEGAIDVRGADHQALTSITLIQDSRRDCFFFHRRRKVIGGPSPCRTPVGSPQGSARAGTPDRFIRGAGLGRPLRLVRWLFSHGGSVVCHCACFGANQPTQKRGGRVFCRTHPALKCRGGSPSPPDTRPLGTERYGLLNIRSLGKSNVRQSILSTNPV